MDGTAQGFYKLCGHTVLWRKALALRSSDPLVIHVGSPLLLLHPCSQKTEHVSAFVLKIQKLSLQNTDNVATPGFSCDTHHSRTLQVDGVGSFSMLRIRPWLSLVHCSYKQEMLSRGCMFHSLHVEKHHIGRLKT